jgi:hypothetical protein
LGAEAAGDALGRLLSVRIQEDRPEGACLHAGAAALAFTLVHDYDALLVSVERFLRACFDAPRFFAIATRNYNI